MPGSASSFRHVAPSMRVHYGKGALDHLHAELARAGCSRALVICGQTLSHRQDGLARVREAAGPAYVGVFDAVQAHSPIPAVIAAADALRAHAADAVIAIGGGSAIVTARAASILLAEGGRIEDLCTRLAPGSAPVSPKLMQPKLPQFLVPTTPTTACAKAGSAVVDPVEHRRLTMYDPKTRAHALFFDDTLMLTARPALVRDAALNAFTMAMQGLESRQAHALSDGLLLHAVRLLRIWLPRLAREPEAAELRGQLMLAALLAGQGTDHAPTGVASVIGHCIASRFGLDPGAANAVMLPHAIRFNAPATVDRLDTVFGTGAPAAAALAETVAEDCQRFFASLGLPARLRDLGVPEEALPQLAVDAQSDWFLRQNPRRVTDGDELAALLAAAW